MMKPKEDPIRLQELNQRRVAIELTVLGRKLVCRGTASYEADAKLGQVVRVPLDEAGGQEIIISEAEFGGTVCATKQCGCEYLVRLT